MLTADTPRRTRLKASGLLIVTFVVGALVGAAGERVLDAREPQQVAQRGQGDRDKDRDRAPGGNRGGSIFLEPGVFDQIGATTEQRKKIQDVLTRREQGVERIWSDFSPRMKAMMDSTRGEIRGQLTTDQQQKLDQLIQERRARFREERGHRPADGKPRSDSAKK